MKKMNTLAFAVVMFITNCFFSAKTCAENVTLTPINKTSDFFNYTLSNNGSDSITILSVIVESDAGSTIVELLVNTVSNFKKKYLGISGATIHHEDTVSPGTSRMFQVILGEHVNDQSEIRVRVLVKERDKAPYLITIP